MILDEIVRWMTVCKYTIAEDSSGECLSCCVLLDLTESTAGNENGSFA